MKANRSFALAISALIFAGCESAAHTRSELDLWLEANRGTLIGKSRDEVKASLEQLEHTKIIQIAPPQPAAPNQPVTEEWVADYGPRPVPPHGVERESGSYRKEQCDHFLLTFDAASKLKDIRVRDVCR